MIDETTGEIIVDGEGFQITPIGLRVDGKPTFEQWMECGQKLVDAKNAVQWCMGDWLLYGEGRGDWGEMYTQAMEQTRLSYRTLNDYAYTCKRFQFNRRRLNLSFSHHVESKSIKDDTDQDALLDKAETEGWSREDMREAVKAFKADQKPKPLPEENQVVAVVDAPTPLLESPPEPEVPDNPPEVSQPPEDMFDEPEAPPVDEPPAAPEPEPVIVEAPKPTLRLYVARAECMPQVEDESVDLIITSPPYNLGKQHWPMGGNGRKPRRGIGYEDDQDELAYQAWQVQCLIEMYRVAKPGASLFYNHKARTKDGQLIHPMDWLRDEYNPWAIRQEIIWDRKATHNHSPTLFWPEDERIYWLTKGKPIVPEYGIGMPSIWREFGPEANRSWHPAPFPESLPEFVISAIGRDGITVLDPFAGSCTTVRVALAHGYHAIGVDISEEYLTIAMEENGWKIRSVA